MLLSGFTFIKNGLKLGYPILESIQSIAEICDEVIINVGFEDQQCSHDDGTYAYLTEHLTDPKFKFLKSWWDPELTQSGLILSQQTNIALEACQGKYCQYIQGDEAIHEDDLKKIQDAIAEMEKNEKLEGAVFRYIHFYGNTNIVKETRNTYRREVRLIRNLSSVKSHLDAQGFRHEDGSKLKCFQIEARIFHYGWARQEQIMKSKVKAFDKLYHGKDFEGNDFHYERIWGLKPFKFTHPKVMENWIGKHENQLDIMALPLKFEWKNIGLAISDGIESLTGYRMGEYKNFKLIK